MTIKNKKSPLKYAVMKDAPEEIIKSLINPSNFWGSLHLGFSPTSTAFKIPKIFNPKFPRFSISACFFPKIAG